MKARLKLCKPEPNGQVTIKQRTALNPNWRTRITCTSNDISKQVLDKLITNHSDKFEL